MFANYITIEVKFVSSSIGEISVKNNNPYIKMWQREVPSGKRSYRRHFHTRFEITVVTSGSGVYTTERKSYPMKKGDVFVFSSNEVHSITEVSEEGLVITNMHFEPRYLADRGAGDISEGYINFCFSHSPEFENRIPASVSGVIRDNFMKIKAEFENKKSGYETLVKAYLDIILVELKRNHSYFSPEAKETSANKSSLASVYEYIEEHLCEALTLEELSEIAHLSPNYLSTVFKQFSGIALWDYITAKRVEKAAFMLSSSKNELSVLEIASLCGFNNTANFNKAFKKYKDVTPSEYRKNPKSRLH